jgi:outer membrane protein assembly factor BamA
MVNFTVTSKQQLIINARSKIYLNNNKWFLQGDWRMLFFTQPTYGLGINNKGDNSSSVAFDGYDPINEPNAEDMKFNYLRIYEDVVRRIDDSHWYVGFGIAFDNHFDIKDTKLNTDSTTPNPYLTQHYLYSTSKGFNTTSYITKGFNFNVLTDTRDNVANPYKGYFASLTYRVNPKIFQSSQASTMILYDARYYLPLSKNIPRHVLCLWSNGTFVATGNVPYLALPSIGWDTYNRSGRGYIQGRFRGLNMVYNEVEYRFPLSKNGLFGGVAFVNGTFAQSETQKLFDAMALGYGFGVRMKMDKIARVNLTADIGFTDKKIGGIYLGLQEIF